MYRRTLCWLKDKGIISHKIWRTHILSKRFGYPLNLNEPETFNEKLNCRILFGRNKKYSLLSDKVAVRDYVNELGLADILVPSLAVVTNAADIPFAGLPKSFVVKAAHGSGWNYFVEDKEQINQAEVIAKCQQWLEQDFANNDDELHYKDIPRRLLIEEKLKDDQGKIPADIKLHVFKCATGSNIIIQYDADRFIGHRRTMFDSNWIALPFTWRVDNIEQKHLPSEPKNFERMKEIALILAADFDYVRVDLYNIDGKIYFGELTFTHESGTSPIVPIEWDRKIGKMWELTIPTN